MVSSDGWVATNQQTVPLSVDSDVAQEVQRGTPKILVTGVAKSGMTATSRRLQGRWPGYKVIDASDHEGQNLLSGDLDQLKTTLEGAIKHDKTILFLHDYWQRILKQEQKPEWIPIPLNKLLAGIFADFTEIRHDLKEEDAYNIVAQQLGIKRWRIPGSLLEALREKAKFEAFRVGTGKEKERLVATYVPKIIIETVTKWKAKNKEIAEKASNETWLEEDRTRIEDAFKRWLDEIKGGFKTRRVALGVLLGSSAGVYSSASNFLETVLAKIGLAATATLANFLTLSIPGGFVVSSVLSFLIAKKVERKEKYIKQFTEEQESFLTAQEYWKKRMLQSEKEVLCYELDKRIGLKPGTAQERLEGRYGYMSQEKLLDWVREQFQPDFEKLPNERIQEIESLLKEFRAQQEELSRTVQLLESLDGVYLNPAPLGLKQQGDNWVIATELVGEPDIELVRTKEFNDFASQVESIIAKGGIAVLVGPQGIGKSLLGRFVLSDAIARGKVAMALDENELPKKLGRVASQFLQLKVVLFYDVSPPELYKPSQLEGAKGQPHWTQQMKDAREEIESKVEEVFATCKEAKCPALIVVPIEPFWTEIDIKNKAWLSRINEALGITDYVISVDLRKEDFLAGIIIAYSSTCGIQLSSSTIHDLTKAVATYRVGYTLVAVYAGRWLKAHCNPEQIAAALEEGKGNAKFFIRRFVQYALLGVGVRETETDPGKLRSFAITLLYHVSFHDHSLPIELARRLPLIDRIPRVEGEVQFPVDVAGQLFDLEKRTAELQEKAPHGPGKEAELRKLIEKKAQLSTILQSFGQVRHDLDLCNGCLSTSTAIWLSAPKEDLIEEALRELVFSTDRTGSETLAKAVDEIRSYFGIETFADEERVEEILAHNAQPLLVLLFDSEEKKTELLAAFGAALTLHPNWGSVNSLLCGADGRITNAVKRSLLGFLVEDLAFERLPLKLDISDASFQVREIIENVERSNVFPVARLLLALGYIAALKPGECVAGALKCLTWAAGVLVFVSNPLDVCLGRSFVLEGLASTDVEENRWALKYILEVGKVTMTKETREALVTWGSQKNRDWISSIFFAQILVTMGESAALTSAAEDILAEMRRTLRNGEYYRLAEIEIDKALAQYYWNFDAEKSLRLLDEGMRAMSSVSSQSDETMEYLRYGGWGYTHRLKFEDWKEVVGGGYKAQRGMVLFSFPHLARGQSVEQALLDALECWNECLNDLSPRFSALSSAGIIDESTLRFRILTAEVVARGGFERARPEFLKLWNEIYHRYPAKALPLRLSVDWNTRFGAAYLFALDDYDELRVILTSLEEGLFKVAEARSVALLYGYLCLKWRKFDVEFLRYVRNYAMHVSEDMWPMLIPALRLAFGENGYTKDKALEDISDFVPSKSSSLPIFSQRKDILLPVDHCIKIIDSVNKPASLAEVFASASSRSHLEWVQLSTSLAMMNPKNPLESAPVIVSLSSYVDGLVMLAIHFFNMGDAGRVKKIAEYVANTFAGTMQAYLSANLRSSLESCVSSSDCIEALDYLERLVFLRLL